MYFTCREAILKFMVLYNSSTRLKVSINLIDVVDSSQCNIFLMSHPVDEIGLTGHENTVVSRQRLDAGLFP